MLGSFPVAQAAGDEVAGAFSEQTLTLTIDGDARTFQVHDFSRAKPASVVIILHGGGGDPDNAVKMTGFNRIAERERFIAVYPAGSARNPRGKLLTWNAGHCCAYAMENKIDDVAFIAALIDQLVAGGSADPKRIYVTGMSNGGMMSHRLGRELSGRIAAIAPVVAAVFGDEPSPAGSLPAFIVVGAEDQTVPAAGGPLQLRGIPGQRSAARKPVAPAIDQATYWARANQCGEPSQSKTAGSKVTTWTGCKDAADVVFHVVANNGHAWPGGLPGRKGADEPTPDFDASEQIWAFFKLH